MKLIRKRAESPPLRWFTKFGVGAAFTFFLCWLATAWFGNRLELPATTTLDGTLQAFNRYLDEATPDVVIVGSSLSNRLLEPYFATPKVRNLSIAGGSPVTGLVIVADQPRFPKIILVEMNVLSRSIDAALVERYSNRPGSEIVFFRPVRSAVAAYEHFLHAPPSRAQGAVEIERLLKQPVSTFDNHVYLNRALAEANTENPSVAAKKNAEMIAQLIPVLQQKGSHVLLMEVPYSPELEASRSVKITREIVRTMFPDARQWLKMDFDKAELRWVDGVHLDERSAAIIVRSIDKALLPLVQAP